MTKIFHEIRDPIHVFVHLDWYEKKVLGSRPAPRVYVVGERGRGKSRARKRKR